MVEQPTSDWQVEQTGHIVFGDRQLPNRKVERRRLIVPPLDKSVLHFVADGMEIPLQICQKKNETTVDTTDVFTTSQRFVTLEEVIRWVKETGINNRVTVIIARSDTETDRLEGHSFVGRLTTDEKQHVADLTKRHVPLRHILISLQERDPENFTRITQIYKHKSVIEAEIRGPKSDIQHLLKLIKEANYVYWSRKRDDSEVVRDIFWAHPDSVKLLNLFPTVLIMDATYKTNKYRQPIFEIVGMTSTELKFAVAFAYMECEQT
ncbi:uncharacterized protein LOC131619771 [Vicia villosa]|uniref:uncharacterized protein LOC131619771 n=1 Tax=Vicia villosa TaxID=3911 RepID=UPI00273A8098|nr:uncharacterized protein LOC131619771 [Vicia villosa]